MNDLLMYTHIKDKGQWEADPPHPKKITQVANFDGGYGCINHEIWG